METLDAVINQRGLIRVEHNKHGSRAMLWLGPEMERFLGFQGEKIKAITNAVRPYCWLICDQLCAMPSLSICEKRDKGAEWMTYKQSHVELSGALICSHCRSGLLKLQIDSFRISADFEEQCGHTWNGATFFDCVVCRTKNRTLVSSRALWESLRVLKPLGLFKDIILNIFSSHPYLGMREHERNVLLEC